MAFDGIFIPYPAYRPWAYSMAGSGPDPVAAPRSALIFACFSEPDQLRDRRHCIRVASVERALVPEDQFAREIDAVKSFAILALDDRKSRENIADIVFVGDAIKNEVEGIEPCAQLASLLLILNKRRLHGAIFVDVAHVAGKSSHVVGGIGETQSMILDDIGGCALAEAVAVIASCENWQLFHDEPIQMLALNL
jgi:hypothetical protein